MTDRGTGAENNHPGERGVVFTKESPFSKLMPVPVRAVRMGEGFWRTRMDLNASVSLPLQMQKLQDSGVLDNFRRASERSEGEFQGMFFADSDLYKWVEAASWALQSQELPDIKRMLDEAIDIIETAQGEDGYLNTYHQGAMASERWTNIGQMHELYCAGHLFQAAVAHHRSTNSNRLLRVACRFADLICSVFGPGGISANPGHPEIEMGLIELFRETRTARYLDMAGQFIDRVGGKHMREMLGHAVRALYFCSGMADYYLETGENAYLEALESLWVSMTETKMYVTGAVGGREVGESFGREFEIPNEHAYAETCAAIASAMWNWRMLAQSADARFADLMELVLYNAVLSGVSLNGRRYFYTNPHASNGMPTDDPWYPHLRKGATRREEWYPCACCPPNIARTLSALPGYVYSTGDDGAWVHLYDTSTLHWFLKDGTPITISQRTDYPWEGHIELDVSSESSREFALNLRIPGWCQQAEVSVDGRMPESVPQRGSYLAVRRVWRGGCRVVLDLDMPPSPMVSNPMAAENRCSVAVKRGPIVYCFESLDNPGTTVRQAALTVDPEGLAGGLACEFAPELLGGVVVVSGKGTVPQLDWGPLYRRLGAQALRTEPTTLRGIPYYAWGNRGNSEMTVWLQLRGRGGDL
jgi:DUF1680 family protein